MDGLTLMNIKHLGETAVALPLEGVNCVRLDGTLEVTHQSLNAGKEGRERIDDDAGELSGVHIDAAVLEEVMGRRVMPRQGCDGDAR